MQTAEEGSHLLTDVASVHAAVILLVKVNKNTLALLCSLLI